MLNLILGGAGSGKTCEMMNRIEAAVKADKDVLVIIPDQFSFEFDRALYDRLGMVLFNRVNVLSFARTAKDIFIKYGGLRGRYADDTVKNITMFRALSNLTERDGLCYYNRQAKSPLFVDSGLDIVKELTLSGVSAEQLADCIDTLDEGMRDKVSDIALIYSEYESLLAAGGYKDGECDVSEAAKRAAENNYFAGKTVFVDAFKSFTADEQRFLEAVISQSESVTVCLATAEPDNSGYSVFDSVNKTLRKLTRAAAECGVKTERILLDSPKRFRNEELAFLSNNILRYTRGKFEGECGNIKVYRSADCYGEGDFVCSEIRRLVMEEGCNYKDIAVLARKKDSYSSVMESSFERYDIPFYTDENYTANHKSLFIFAITALRLASNKKAAAEDWLRYMKTGMAGLSYDEIAAAESYCYKWSVEGKMWEEPFIFDDAEIGAEAVRQRVTAPIFRLRDACADADGSEICRAVLTLFDDVGLEETLCGIYDNCTVTDVAALSAVREIRQLWELLCGLLETMNKVLRDTKVSLADFAELFANAVGKLKLSSPPQTLDSVQFMSAHTARLAEPKVIFVLGANEGIFPFASKPSGLFSDRDRLALESVGIQLSGGVRDKLAEERFVAYSVLSGASEKLYVSYPMSDVAGNPLYPSQIVSQITEMFGEETEENFEKRGLISFCTTADSAYYQYVQNYKRGDTESASIYAALDSIPEYSERLKYLKSVEFSAAHSLLPETGKKLFGSRIYMSASRFEDYRKCPFMYFCKKGLSVFPPDRIEFDNRSKGNAIHYCLCEFLKENCRNDFVVMTRNEISERVKKHLDEYYRSDAVGGDYGKSRRYMRAFERLSETLTDILERLSDEFRQSRFEPKEFEYTLKRSSGDEKAFELKLPDGTTVCFEGSVDRIDLFTQDGEQYIRVVDYKSGTKDFDLAELIYGLNMQMLLYLFALTDSGHKGKYADAEPSGVLYMPAKDIASALERNDGEEAADKAINSTFKMKGLVLDNDLVIGAMERNIGGVYVPVKELANHKSVTTSDGTVVTVKYDRYSKLIRMDELENLRRYSYKLMKKTAESLVGGRIEALPLINGESSPCGYCSYKSVCGNYPPAVSRQFSQNAGEDIRSIMSGKIAGNALDEYINEMERTGLR